MIQVQLATAEII